MVKLIIWSWLHHLILSLEIGRYSATGKIYPEVIKTLKPGFGRDDITEYYIREQLKIIICISSCSTKVPMVEMYDKFKSLLGNLEKLGVSSETCATILLPLVSSCLSEDILKFCEFQILGLPLNKTIHQKIFSKTFFGFHKRRTKG